MLSLRHEVFMEVAAHLSFSEASRILFISQPAISKHIRALEQHYMVTLFERRGSTVKLTAAGQMLYARLKEARDIQKQLEFEISTLKNQYDAKGHLKLGASTTVALYIIPKVLSAFHLKYPGIKISLLNRNTDTIIKALLDGEIDLGIVEGRNKINSILYTPFISDEVIPVCSIKSEIAQKGKITLQDLENIPIVLREHGSGTLEVLVHELKKHNIKISDLKVSVRLAGTEALKNFLREDVALGFLSKRSVMKELKSGELATVTVEKLSIVRNFFFIQRQGAQTDRLGKSFIKFTKLYNKEHNTL